MCTGSRGSPLALASHINHIHPFSILAPLHPYLPLILSGHNSLFTAAPQVSLYTAVLRSKAVASLLGGGGGGGEDNTLAVITALRKARTQCVNSLFHHTARRRTPGPAVQSIHTHTHTHTRTHARFAASHTLSLRYVLLVLVNTHTHTHTHTYTHAHTLLPGMPQVANHPDLLLGGGDAADGEVWAGAPAAP